MRRQKYGARRTAYKGVTYDSGAEAARAAQLDLLVKAGNIKRWERGKSRVILDDGQGNKVRYRPDFEIVGKRGEAWVEDVKSIATVTREFRIKAILWKKAFPDLPLLVIDAYGRPVWSLK